MFTGIIEAIGEIKRLRQSTGQLLLSIHLDHLARDVHEGDSIAVNGVCLTVSKLDKDAADFDVSSETVRRSTLSALKTGSKVNLERAMSAQGRFGGHIVQGHVDGTARIVSIRKEGQFAEFQFEANRDLMTQIVLKGSIALDGISLTISKLENSRFSASLIPSTLEHTTWHDAKIGDLVNVETDILVKIIQAQLAAIRPIEKGLIAEKLASYGF